MIGVTQRGNKTFTCHLARMMHKVFNVSPKPSALIARPASGCSRAWRNALRTAFSTPHYKNLCIIRTSIASGMLTG